MRNWPNWIPNPSAWMSALVVILLAFGIQAMQPILSILINWLINIAPKLGIVAWIIIFLSPIILVAFVHHFLHLALDRFFPDTQSPEMEHVQGFFPSLMSWWEGLYSWLVIYLALLISSLIQSVITPNFDPFSPIDWWEIIFKGLFTVTNLIRLIVAAYLYQFESLVRQHLMSVGASRRL